MLSCPDDGTPEFVQRNRRPVSFPQSRMIASELINHMVPPLKVTDDAHKAIVWMEEFRCNFLPVVDAGALQGFISEEIIMETNDIEKTVGAFSLVGKECTVSMDSHFF